MSAYAKGHKVAATDQPEKSVREVNKQIRKETRQQKQRDKAAARGVGAGVKVLDRCQRRHPSDPKAQLVMYMSEFVIKSAIGRIRPVSERTNTSYADNLMWCIEDLKVKNAAIRNLGELGKKHVLVLVRYWIERGQASSTIQNKISVLRRFLTWIGKDQAVPCGSELKALLGKHGIEVPNWKSTVATVSKAWNDNDVDAKEVLHSVQGKCPLTAMQLEMCEAFGLRVLECLSLNPIANDYGDMLQLNHGTKGGLPRSIPFSLDEVTSAHQRDVLERAKLFAKKHPKGLLARPGYSLKKNVRRFYYVLERVGITRKVLGVTAHGLRHQYIGRELEQRTGFKTPVSGGMPLLVTAEMKDAYLQASVEVSRATGHFRPCVIHTYAGSIPMTSRHRKRRVAEWVNLTEGNARFQAALKKYEVRSAWLGGRFAMGLEVTPFERIRLYVSVAGGLTDQAMYDLQNELSASVSRGVDISEYRWPGSPEESLEIFVRPEPADGNTQRQTANGKLVTLDIL